MRCLLHRWSTWRFVWRDAPIFSFPLFFFYQTRGTHRGEEAKTHYQIGWLAFTFRKKGGERSFTFMKLLSGWFDYALRGYLWLSIWFALIGVVGSPDNNRSSLAAIRIPELAVNPRYDRSTALRERAFKFAFVLILDGCISLSVL